MSTGKSAAKRDSKRQRQLIQEQQRETQKALSEEKDIESRQRRTLKLSKAGRGSLITQQENLNSLLGASRAMEGTGGGEGGASLVTGAGFIDPTNVGEYVEPGRKEREEQQKKDVKRTAQGAGRQLSGVMGRFR